MREAASTVLLMGTPSHLNIYSFSFNKVNKKSEYMDLGNVALRTAGEPQRCSIESVNSVVLWIHTSYHNLYQQKGD